MTDEASSVRSSQGSSRRAPKNVSLSHISPAFADTALCAAGPSLLCIRQLTT
jgi:hypothetical protein